MFLGTSGRKWKRRGSDSTNPIVPTPTLFADLILPTCLPATGKLAAKFLNPQTSHTSANTLFCIHIIITHHIHHISHPSECNFASSTFYVVIFPYPPLCRQKLFFLLLTFHRIHQSLPVLLASFPHFSCCDRSPRTNNRQYFRYKTLKL